MNITGKLVVAGIVLLLEGVLQLAVVAVMLLNTLNFHPLSDEIGWAFLAVFYVSPFVVSGPVSLFGGLAALKANHFRLAMAGALMTLAPLPVAALFLATGDSGLPGATPVVLALVSLAVISLTFMSRKDFAGTVHTGSHGTTIAGVMLLIIGALRLADVPGMSWDVSRWTRFPSIDIVFQVFLSVAGVLAVMSGVLTIMRRRWLLAFWSAMVAVLSVLAEPLFWLAFGPVERTYVWISSPLSPTGILYVLMGIVTFLIMLVSRDRFNHRNGSLPSNN